MNTCNVLLPGGKSGDCQIPLKEVKNLLICDKDVSFSYTAKEVLSNWTNLIKQDLTIYAIAGLVGYNNTTDEPTIVGSGNMAKKVIDNPLPSFELFLDSNVCDFKNMLTTLKGGVYGVFYELEDGTILGSIDQSGTEIGYLKPYQVTIKANTKLNQEKGSVNAFRVYVNHLNFSQVENQFVFSPAAWEISELVDAMPIGLNILKPSVYASGDQEVQINLRGSDAYTGLVVGDFETSTAFGNVAVPAVTALVENGLGSYTLTRQKAATPANLVDGDALYLRVKKLSGSDVTHMSGWIRIEGVT